VAETNSLLIFSGIVPECFEYDNKSQWKSMENWGIRPQLSPKPLSRLSLNLAWLMMSGTPTPVQNFIAIQ